MIAWHRKGFRLFWIWKVRHGQPGRLPVPQDDRDLIRKMEPGGSTVGALHGIHGEAAKLGIDVGETSVGKYDWSAAETTIPDLRPPSQSPEDTGVGRLLRRADHSVPDPVVFGLAHDRRRILHFAVTSHPSAEWTAQQLREAFPWDTAPRYLLRDRDRIFARSSSSR